MHRLKLTLAAMAVSVLLLALWSNAPVGSHGQTMVSCATDYGHAPTYSVTEPDGVGLTGDGCVGYGSGFAWYVLSTATTNTSVYAVQSQSYGYDLCNGAPQPRYDMGGDGAWVYNTTQGTAGWYPGTYQDCGAGHTYENFTAGYEELSSGSSTYGGNGWYFT